MMSVRTALKILALACCAAPLLADASPELPRGTAALNGRTLTVHGFRSPSIGVELSEGSIGLHVGIFPLIADDGDDGARTTWFAKTGLTVYPLRLDLGSGRSSGPFASLSLMQGLNNEWDVARSVRRGTGVHGELGFVWAIGAGLDLRLGIGVLVGADDRVVLHPTPGVSWSVSL
jgi:hypothetical protein